MTILWRQCFAVSEWVKEIFEKKFGSDFMRLTVSRFRASLPVLITSFTKKFAKILASIVHVESGTTTSRNCCCNRGSVQNVSNLHLIVNISVPDCFFFPPFLTIFFTSRMFAFFTTFLTIFFTTRMFAFFTTFAIIIDNVVFSFSALKVPNMDTLLFRLMRCCQIYLKLKNMYHKINESVFTHRQQC